MRREYVRPDARYRKIGLALCTQADKPMAHTILEEQPAGTFTVEVEIRYRNAAGRQIGDVMGFELLSEQAAAELRARFGPIPPSVTQ